VEADGGVGDDMDRLTQLQDLVHALEELMAISFDELRHTGGR
jgi:hypothetical protein